MFALVVVTVAAVIASSTPGITRHQAAAHPMRYYVALPVGWVSGRTWPVVVVIADAHRDFPQNLKRFVEARSAMPFVLVAPEVLTCGGSRDQTSPPYSYTVDEWRTARAVPDYAFDDSGLAVVLAEVHQKWGGEERAYLTGWEAGGHTVWAQTLRRPERWLAVAPVTPNYQGRGLTPESFSRAPERAALPIQVFWCGAPKEGAAAMPAFRQQTDRALADARAHGFAPVTVRVVGGADHGPLEVPVLAWFDSLAQLRRDSGRRSAR